MAKLVTGLYNSRSSAMLAIEDLMRHGVPQDDISLMMTDTNLGREFFTDVSNKAPEGGVWGTIIGGILGAVFSALVAMHYITDPGIGLGGLSVLMATLVGLGAGAVIGLIIGAAIGASIPEYELNLYRTDKRHSGILVGVYSHLRRESEVRYLLKAAGARDIRTKNVRDEALPDRSRDYARAVDRDREATR